MSLQQKDIALCLKTVEIPFKEAWDTERAKINLPRNCNLPETNANKKLLKQQLDIEIDECYDKFSNMRILKFLNSE